MPTSILSLGFVPMFALLACTADGSSEGEPGLANPASVYCEEQAGVVEIREDDEGNQTGICVFANGAECEEWAYYRGDCSPEDKLDND